MVSYDFCTDYYEIFAGTNNTSSRAYIEAAQDSPEGKKALENVKKLCKSIEAVSGKVDSGSFRASKGNIEQYSGYQSIKTVISWIDGTNKGVSIPKSDGAKAYELYKFLLDNKAKYAEGYQRKIKLLMEEYENAMYVLTTSLSILLLNAGDMVENSGSVKWSMSMNYGSDVDEKILGKLVKELTSRTHAKYIDSLITLASSKDNSKAATESVDIYTEIALFDSIDSIGKIWDNVVYVKNLAIKTLVELKNSLFGIIPIIRAIIYLRYKRKANKIMSLEEQVDFIEKNIEQLRLQKTMDPEKRNEIIMKQQAYAAAYKKKAEKLRAQLTDSARDGSKELDKDNDNIRNDKETTVSDDNDDDFVIESYLESTNKKSKDFFKNAHKKTNRSQKEIMNMRKEKLFGNNKIKSVGYSGSHPFDDSLKELDAKEIWEAIKDEIKERTKREVLWIDIDEFGKRCNYTNKDLPDTKTKFGGYPYWPKIKEKEWNNKYSKLAFIAQINFSELPKIEGFPNSGILQFFYERLDITDRETYGDDVPCIFHENIDDDSLDTSNGINTLNIKNPSEEWSTITGVIYPKFEKRISYLCNTNLEYEKDNFIDLLSELTKKHFDINSNIKGSDIDDYLFLSSYYKELEKEWIHEGCLYGCKIGGYPDYTQNDQRPDKTKGKWIQLLQLDGMFKNISIGDAGFSHFFISFEDLKKKNFNNVKLIWDCY